ncbi:DNA polymerase III, beta subunit [uncultured Desulfovibrio sp.]|uniref:Beta sliding clamp n=1 Tax=uncultured Desulfovibrio sp. TaxID=167968 RepID=A0A212JTN8_9BACT|nr:DNA polymerase III subunit beta [Desulfovibrio desulfuricans]MCB6541438.1 DNA polymerase III subunit beta [Desulfovibrio desulfuricans]MCB6552520.1 DNA polymerase III subunit beta [Desulfovibrio desulfuricans]MCB6564232.1 DNA polymerase III subunit beta [Desulfovibrio desulfuricans]MCB7345544.1 DNA polymerase III subunit beta [Desulfovibrio desulfuricans]MCQ4860945.1 DNA polymerase III subunit beta [Desulfovibrio desulfuricans]
MKLTVNKEQIIEGLLKAAAIIPAKAGAQYLRSIWLKAEEGSLSVMSTDANIEFTGRYPAEVAAPGLIGVQGRAFVDLVRQLPTGVLHLTLDETSGNLLLEQGRRTYKLPVSGAEWFQNFSAFPAENAVTWSGDFLQDILDKVGFCISDDDAMDAIACLCMKPRGNGRIDVCGLNGHQFALVSFTHDELAERLPEGGMLIQKKYLADIKKWLGVDEIELNITDKRLYLRSLDGAETLSLPRAAHEYPDYNIFMSKLASEDMHPMTLARKEAIEALGRILIFNTESDRCTYMDLSAGEALLSAQGQDVGSANESLEVAYNGDIKRIAFPTRNLLDVLGHFVSAKIDMMLTGSEGPCGIRGADDADYTVIIMPMKVSETTYYSEEDV